MFDPEVLVNALPKRALGRANLQGTKPARGSPSARPYNGFTPSERGRTSALAKWLQEAGSMSPPERCDICSRPASQHHAEDYYDLSTWIEICAGCHGILHKRFANPAAWSRRLDVFGIAPDHWARLISPEPFHLADYLRARGAVEPTAEALALQLSKATSRRPQQDFTEMGLNRGDQLVFAPAPDEVVIVENDRHLAWRGQLYSLTALTRLLAANSGCSRSTRHWRIGEQLLDDIYDNTYGMLG